MVGDTCGGGTRRCTYKEHDHEYDDIYDKTGVNFLNASNANFNLEKAIPSTSTQFKVIGQNQYLSPALRLHIGNSGYLFNIDSGYIEFKTFTTTSTLDLATLPTYTRATIGSRPRQWFHGTTIRRAGRSSNQRIVRVVGKTCKDDATGRSPQARVVQLVWILFTS